MRVWCRVCPGQGTWDMCVHVRVTLKQQPQKDQVRSWGPLTEGAAWNHLEGVVLVQCDTLTEESSQGHLHRGVTLTERSPSHGGHPHGGGHPHRGVTLTRRCLPYWEFALTGDDPHRVSCPDLGTILRGNHPHRQVPRLG